MNKGVLIHSELTDIFELMRRQRRGDDINDVDADRLLVEAASKVQSLELVVFEKRSGPLLGTLVSIVLQKVRT